MSLSFLSRSIAYGGDYNPEQWPESVWAEDIRLMKEASVNLVTVGVFSWSKLQSAEGVYDFGWLDRVMELLAASGIGVDLATATASPPPWMSHHFPDVLAIDSAGVPYHPGSRQHYSPFSPTYRRQAAELVRRLAERYANHPALKAWHVNNEYMCHVRECHSVHATTAFRAWLKAKYGALSDLNSAWTTSFWSQHYQSWDEILTPRRAPYTINPTQQLDYQRFMSDAVLELYTMERDILREVTPNVPITTNFMGFFKAVDQHRWGKEIDFASWDSYPDPTPGAKGEYAGAAGHDLTRSVKKNTSFVLMEQAASAVNWRPVNAAKPPGLMRLWSMQAVARGADGVLFFQWRASLGGGEKYHSAMLGHTPPSQSRVFKEICALGRELKSLSSVAGSRVVSQVAIIFDWSAWWAVELDAKPTRFDYSAWAQELHRYFYERNIAVDFVSASASLSDYRLVVAPALYLLNALDAFRLTRYVEEGGTLLATYFSGIVDENDRVVLGGYGGHLRKVLGLWVEEWVPYGPEAANFIRFQNGPAGADEIKAACGHWCEVVHLNEAKAIARFEKDFFADGAAVTIRSLGLGTSYYLATKPEATGIAHLLDLVCAQAKVQAVLRTPAGVEVTLRETPAASFLFLLNHTPEAVRISLGKLHGRNLLEPGAECRDAVDLSAGGVCVLEVVKAQESSASAHEIPSVSASR